MHNKIVFIKITSWVIIAVSAASIAGWLLEVELLELPGKSVSKKAARDLYRVLKDEKLRDEPF
jgi:hypothetical protein